MKIEVLGSGCAKCAKLHALTTEVVNELGLGDAQVEKVEDVGAIMGYGVMVTPALAVDGKVLLSGRLPGKAELTESLRKAATS